MVFDRTYRRIPRLRGRVVALKNKLIRARYFRGHGVHSPFVYDIVRQVFMCRRLIGPLTALYDALCVEKVSLRRAMELQNLMNHCGYCSFAIYGQGPDPIIGTEKAELHLLLAEFPTANMLHRVSDASASASVVVVMAPYADRDRERMCRMLVARHDSTTVDNCGYLLVFNNSRLPKQHFRI